MNFQARGERSSRVDAYGNRVAVDKLRDDHPALVAPMERLCALFALSWIERDLGAFLLSGHLTPNHGFLVKEAQAKMLAAVRPDTVALVDAFGKTDFELNSAIGRADGDYITALYELAKREPLNASHEVGFDQEHLRFLKDVSATRPLLGERCLALAHALGAACRS